MLPTVQNKQLSDPQDGIMALQGVPYHIRQIQKIAKVQMDIAVDRLTPGDRSNAASAHAEPSSCYQMSMTSALSGLGFVSAAPLRALGISMKNTEVRRLDGSEFTQDEPVIGKFAGRTWLCTVAELAAENIDPYLKDSWVKDHAGASSNEDEYVIRWSMRSLKAGPDPWRSEQVWGIDESGRYSGRIRTTKGLTESACAKLVFDYQG